MRKRIIALSLVIAISLSAFSVPKAKAIEPVSAAFLAVSIGHLALDAYRTWRAEHPSEPDSAYTGYNPGGIVSDDASKGGSFSSSGKFGTAYTSYVETLSAMEIGNDGSFTLPMSHASANCYAYLGSMKWNVSCPHVSGGQSNTFSTCNDYVVQFVSNNGFFGQYARNYTYLYELNYWRFTFAYTAVSPVDGFISFSDPDIDLVSERSGTPLTTHITFNRSIPSYTCTAGQAISYSLNFGDNGGTSFPDSAMDLGYRIGTTLLFRQNSLPRVSVHPYTSYYNVRSTSDDDVYNIYTRPASITGNYGIITESGDVQQIESQTIVNEGSSTVYNPGTNTTYDMQDWNYDYSDRSYHITTTEGDALTVTYGDENVTIVEGDTIYTVYYIINNDSSGGSDTPEPTHTHTYTSSVTVEPTCTLPGVRTYTCDCGASYTESIPATGHAWAVKQTVHTQYDDAGQLIQQGYTIFSCSVCGEEYKAVDDALPPGYDAAPESGSGGSGMTSGSQLEEYVSIVQSWGTGLREVYTGYVGFLSDIFPYLPPELLNLFYWGLAAVVFTGVFRRFIWR